MKELSLFKYSYCKKLAHLILILITCHNIAMSALNSTCSLVKVVIWKFWLFGRKENWSICYLAKRVPSLLQECFINHHKTQSKCSLFLLETTARKRKKNNLNQNVNSLFPYHHYFTSSFLWVLHFYSLSNWLLSAGWVPETPRSFQYWQPAPSDMDTAPMAHNPGNPAMSPHMEGETGTRHTKLMVERESKGRRNAWGLAPMQHIAHCTRYPCEGCQHVSVQEQKYHWLPQSLFVVNSVKLHLHVTAFKVQLIYYTNYASKSMLQYIPHIKLQMDAEVSLWTKKNGLPIDSLLNSTINDIVMLKAGLYI